MITPGPTPSYFVLDDFPGDTDDEKLASAIATGTTRGDENPDDDDEPLIVSKWACIRLPPGFNLDLIPGWSDTWPSCGDTRIRAMHRAYRQRQISRRRRKRR